MKRFLIDSVGKLDIVVWGLVLLFFLGSALLFGGNFSLASLGALGIIVEMLIIGLAVEVIIECLKNTKSIGTLTGFITNGPEAITLIVGLVAGDVIFAASTPLGSNFMNPVLLLVATLICACLGMTLKTKTGYFIPSVIFTATIAASFFFIPESLYVWWIAIAMAVSVPLFLLRPSESEENAEDYSFNPGIWLPTAIALLTIAGYYLDRVVSFTATHSMAPKGVIGFFVLATLTSWPEFKSCLALLKRNNYLGAILNIVVSNITNLWLAVVGIIVYLLAH